MAESFPPTFRGREGYVVEFMPDTEAAWVGNFAPGISGYSGVHMHPNKQDVVVFFEGEGYIVDPDAKILRGEIPGAIFELWEVTDPAGFVMDRQGLAFERISAEGLVWHTRRLSWDGFRSVNLSSTYIDGEAWSPIEDKWIPFRVDVMSGRAEGGSFSAGDLENWEQLAT
jgi:hypothetical protein